MPNQYSRSSRPAIFPIGPSIAYIVLTRGLFALVDWDDALWLQDYCWYAVPWGRKGFKKWYAARSRDGKQYAMHTAILQTTKGVEADHKLSSQTLNNMRFNLRKASDLQNSVNAQLRVDSTTGVKGVTFNKRLRKYVAQTNIAGKRQHLGVRDTLEEASALYAEKVKKLHGEFARLA